MVQKELVVRVEQGQERALEELEEQEELELEELELEELEELEELDHYRHHHRCDRRPFLVGLQMSAKAFYILHPNLHPSHHPIQVLHNLARNNKWVVHI
jgi:hypothetical protein